MRTYAVYPDIDLAKVLSCIDIVISCLGDEIREAFSISQHFDGFYGPDDLGSEIDAILRCLLVAGLFLHGHFPQAAAGSKAGW